MIHLKKIGKLFQLGLGKENEEIVYNMNWQEMAVLFCLVSSIMCKYIKTKKKG